MAEVTNEAELDALPIGSWGYDKDGYPIIKIGRQQYLTVWPSEGQWRGIDDGEILGHYSGEPSGFLPLSMVVDDD